MQERLKARKPTDPPPVFYTLFSDFHPANLLISVRLSKVLSLSWPAPADRRHRVPVSKRFDQVRTNGRQQRLIGNTVKASSAGFTLIRKGSGRNASCVVHKEQCIIMPGKQWSRPDAGRLIGFHPVSYRRLRSRASLPSLSSTVRAV
jgi:hypothetical protein